MRKIKKNTANVAEAKAKLSKYLQLAKQGQETVILEYRTPVAKIVPIEQPALDDLELIEPTAPISVIHSLSKKIGTARSFDAAAILIEDRN